MSEQRVISSSKRPIGGIRESKVAEAAPADTKKKKKSGKKPKKLVLIIGAAVAVLAVGGAAYFFLLKPGGEPAAEPAPVPGAVVSVEAVSINLSDGHYLRLGLGLQLTADVGEEAPDTSKALDHAIALFSGHTVEEVSDPVTREALKAELVSELAEAYEGEVMDVYLTDFVTQ
ncbi:flagellar basal body-associated FliL family protein [Pengzhenrongella frigida]|uniref:Flagellar protein FliL n=1 Tax=Pengzhenrongella frigida TaxID=1259133 RepID=A0A4Q5MYL5_9MICO|nr:flagellar basal body-associated FliL family protein [Cellulomonas sp. HLT2-17]RYV50013.1 flagellar basal body rod protein [Cellulomonas sp. HLT2-17]